MDETMGINTLDFPKGESSNIKIVVYVPSTRNIDNPVSEHEFQRRIKGVVIFLRKTIGGSTRLRGIGNYHSDELNKSVTEKVAKIESFTTKDKYYAKDLKIKKYLLNKKKEWGQEWVSYEYNNELFLI